jgi:hypothetical protein
MLTRPLRPSSATGNMRWRSLTAKLRKRQTAPTLQMASLCEVKLGGLGLFAAGATGSRQ